MKRLYCLYIIILYLAISIPSYAQFTINGKNIIYDKQNVYGKHSGGCFWQGL